MWISSLGSFWSPKGKSAPLPNRQSKQTRRKLRKSEICRLHPAKPTDLQTTNPQNPDFATQLAFVVLAVFPASPPIGPPVVIFLQFFGEGVPTKIDYGKRLVPSKTSQLVRCEGPGAGHHGRLCLGGPRAADRARGLLLARTRPLPGAAHRPPGRQRARLNSTGEKHGLHFFFFFSGVQGGTAGAEFRGKTVVTFCCVFVCFVVGVIVVVRV